jgi:hypothetical protein
VTGYWPFGVISLRAGTSRCPSRSNAKPSPEGIDQLIPFVVAKCREVLDAEGVSVLLLDRDELLPYAICQGRCWCFVAFNLNQFASCSAATGSMHGYTVMGLGETAGAILAFRAAYAYEIARP